MIRAALHYFALIFALGFVLGTVRTLWLEPQWGRMLAVAVELPIILGASWFAARWAVRRYHIRTAAAALGMGALAFTVLIGAEAALAVTLGGGSLADWLNGLATPAGALGLAGQVVFALMPWIVWRID